MGSDRYSKGYKGGLKGEGSSTTWGDAFADATVNPTGSAGARREGYQAGLRDRAFNQAQNKNKK